MKTHRTFTKTIALAALLFSLAFAQQSYAAAPASDVDPSRFKIGNVVYPPGKKPTAADLANIKARSLTGKKSTAVTIAPKGKPTPPAKHKSDD